MRRSTMPIDVCDEADEFVDASLEGRARGLELKIAELELKQTLECVATVARLLRSFKLATKQGLHVYGTEYENGAQHFIDLADRAVDAAKTVPESIARTDNEGDRSAHAALQRHRKELTAHVRKVCQKPKSK